MKEKHRFRWLKFLFIFLFVIVAIFLYATKVSPKKIVAHEINIIDSNIPASFYGFKIAQLSDIHYKTTIKAKQLKELVNKVNKSKPDIIIINGDLLDKKIVYNEKDAKNLTDALNNLKAQYKFIITGDHDLGKDIFKEIINKTDFKLLDNTYEVIYNKTDESILISGLSTSKDHINISDKLSFLETAFEKNNPKYSIIAIHEPSNIEQIDSSFNLVLAGHTHNGELNIPLLKQFLIPSNDNKYTKTYYNFDGMKMYISSGIGTTNVKARLFNPPSFNLFRLLNK